MKFDYNDERYLKRLIGRNEVVLFLGAGFSLNAKNKLGEHFPTGKSLGQKIWDFVQYKGVYDGTPLPEMYQAFVNAGIKKNLKKDFLENNLLSGEIPDIYNAISIPYWYKVYTLNIDDILNKIYSRKNKKYEELIYPKDEFKERDQSLERTHMIYLHGKLPCEPEDLIFSTKQYAKSQLSHQPLYAQFVYDYATKPTIFLGTDLNEPLFERYIEAREGKSGYSEFRPKSFIISPSLSPVKSDNLKHQYNVHHIEGTTEDFLNWLVSISNELPKREDILRDTFPNLLSVLEFSEINNISKKATTEFAGSFNRVPNEHKIIEERSGYLLGASPRWNDLFKDLDIPRTLTNAVFNDIENVYPKNDINEKIKLFSILGSAGAGKSTILKRLGLRLSQNGRTVFLTYSDYLPRFEHITEVLQSIKERVILIFDNAKNAIPQLPNIIKALNNLEKPPIIIVSLRKNHHDKLNSIIDSDIVDHFNYNIDDLDDIEINNLIAKLDANNLLGILKGLTPERRFWEFKYRSKKQILIAMKEATNGRSFNEIIKNEYEEINPEEAKLLCICIALNTELGYTNTKQDFIGFSKEPHSVSLYYLNTILSGTIMWVGSNRDKFMLRHRILADYIIKHCASLESIKEAYIRVLSILAPELKNSQGATRKFNLYKSLINHQTLYQRFRNDINQAREVYDSINSFFNDDPQFWLQYGSLEVEGVGGDLSLAENYLNQAESLSGKDYFIQNAKCNLFYKKSCIVTDYTHAFAYKEKADELAKKLIVTIGKDDPHIYHIYCGGNYNFIKKWVKDKEEKKHKLKELKSSIKNAIILHPRDKKLDIASQAINRAYLNLGISNEDIEDPEIPKH
ncbi:MAG: SIR2 family protein [Bacteroidetes bacterium]|nr:SIR2 family protein [Bacteroidota bacterium]